MVEIQLIHGILHLEESSFENACNLRAILPKGIETKEARDIIFKCLDKSFIKLEDDSILKINVKLFDDNKEFREDYYTIIGHCIEVNTKPFLKSLTSLSTIMSGLIPSANLEQK